MYFNKLKKMAAVFLSLTLAVSFTACGQLKDAVSKKGDGEQETTTQDSQTASEEENSEVELPDDFGDMIYPLEALMVQSYSKELPYFDENSGEEEADSFWFSMAVLTSQMNTYVKDVTTDTDDRFLYISEDTVNMYASALYDSFGKGNMEFPELSEGNTYACYDEEKEAYGFRKGDIGDLESMITDCREDSGDYILTTELRDSDSLRVLGIYEITITKTSYQEEENAFAYSVSDFRTLNMEEEPMEEATDEESAEATTEKEWLEEAATEDGAEEETTAEEEETEEEESSANKISQEEAMERAKEYYGSDAEYTYKGMETVGDYIYYNFSVKGDDISATDVLVSENGNDVIGGTKNDDGSWSFDQ